ncbi:unnamed protein product [Prorocentrum cordatum]|uniref:Uncharacterized protein n=1 Tax=Prorocentrum cordatum TaxID=2364126 RepID=A0ABN9X861_9DINO|nr:unnamed protein product [Polarella glacialis]
MPDRRRGRAGPGGGAALPARPAGAGLGRQRHRRRGRARPGGGAAVPARACRGWTQAATASAPRARGPWQGRCPPCPACRGWTWAWAATASAGTERRRCGRPGAAGALVCLSEPGSCGRDRGAAWAPGQPGRLPKEASQSSGEGVDMGRWFRDIDGEAQALLARDERRHDMDGAGRRRSVFQGEWDTAETMNASERPEWKLEDSFEREFDKLVTRASVPAETLASFKALGLRARSDMTVNHRAICHQLSSASFSELLAESTELFTFACVLSPCLRVVGSYIARRSANHSSVLVCLFLRPLLPPLPRQRLLFSQEEGAITVPRQNSPPTPQSHL